MSLSIDRSAWGVSLNGAHPVALLPASPRVCLPEGHTAFSRAATGDRALTGLTRLSPGENQESATYQDSTVSGPQSPRDRPQAHFRKLLNRPPGPFTAFAMDESRHQSTRPRPCAAVEPGSTHAATHLPTNHPSELHGNKHTLPEFPGLRLRRRRPQSQPKQKPHWHSQP